MRININNVNEIVSEFKLRAMAFGPKQTETDSTSHQPDGNKSNLDHHPLSCQHGRSRCYSNGLGFQILTLTSCTKWTTSESQDNVSIASVPK